MTPALALATEIQSALMRTLERVNVEVPAEQADKLAEALRFIALAEHTVGRDAADIARAALAAYETEDVREDGPLFARLDVQCGGRSFVVQVEEVR